MSKNVLAFVQKGRRLALLCLLLTLGLLSPSWRSAVSWAAPLGQSGQISFTQSFSPNAIAVGSISTLTYTINNAGTQPASDLAFANTLPTNVTVAAPSGVATTCADVVVTATQGTDSIAMTGGRLGAGQSCTVTVNVTANAAGSYANTTGDLTSNLGNSGTSSATLTVSATVPPFSKSFSPASIGVGQNSRLTFVIDNSGSGSAAGSVSFTDALPTGMVVADLPNALVETPSACALIISNTPVIPATLTATAGSSTISFSGYVPAAAICRISVDVKATLVGTLGNLTGNLTTQVGNAGKAGAVLEVTRSLLGKVFTTDPAAPGELTTLEFTLSNFDRGSSLTDIAFTDDLNAALSGLAAVGTPLIDPCGAGSQLSGINTLTFSGGSLSPESSCTFSVQIQVPGGAAAGVYTNTTSTVSAQLDGSPISAVAATDRLTVAAIPQLSKTFVPATVKAGDTVDLVYTITNTDPISTVSSITFDDSFEFLVGTSVSTLPTNGFCGVSSTSQAVSGIIFRVSAASLDPGASCTFTLTLTIPSGASNGAYPSSTGTISAAIGDQTLIGSGATDTLNVVSVPSLSKTFVENPVSAGETVTLLYTLSHDEDASTDATDIGFTDDLDAALSGLVATGLPQNDVCGKGSQISGTSTLTLTGATLSPGSACSFSVTLQVPASAAAGSYPSASSDVTATVDSLAVTGPGATTDLEIASIIFSKSFTANPAVPGMQTSLVFTISNSSPVATATNLAFSDNLGTVLTSMVASGTPLSDVCGVGSTLSGTSTLALSGGSVAPNSSCVFSVTVQIPVAAAAGEYVNLTSQLTGILDSLALQEDPANATLFVAETLAFSKEFLDDPVPAGSTVDLSFTITNNHPSAQATGLTFTDDLDATLSGLVAGGLPANDVCGAGSQLSSTSLLTLTGGTLAANASCTFSVTLQVPGGTSVGTLAINTTSALSGTVDSLAVTADPAVDTLDVDVFDFSKHFDGPTVRGGSAVLTFTVANQDPSTTVSGLAFTDDLNAVLSGLVATGLPRQDVCGAGSQLSGTSLLTLSNGSLPAGESCTFTTTVQIPSAAAVGDYVNTTSALFASGVQVRDAVTATLSVQPPPTFTKAFSPSTIYAGETSTLTFTIDNSASVLAASNLTFTDTLPSGLTFASPSNLAKTCSGGSLNASNGVVSYSGGSLAAGASCTLHVAVTTSTAGSYPNTSGTLTSSSGDSGTAAATLTVNPAANLVLAKTDGVDPLAAGSTLTYTLTITNQGPSPATSVLITDTLPGAFSLTGNSCGASGTPLVWSIASLAANGVETCVLTGTVAAATSAVITNTAVATSAIYDPQPAAATVTETTQIFDNFFSIGNVRVDEGNSGVVLATFTVTRTDNSVASAVDVQTVDDTATAGTDYTALAPTTVNFALGGALTQTISVSVTGDLRFENDETFTVTLSNPVLGTILTTAAVGTIANDDSPPTFSINDPVGVENGATLTFTVSLNAVSGLTATVNYGSSNGSALAGVDYQSTGGSLTIPAGQTQATVTVPLIDDAIDEPTETFTITLSGPTNATLNDATGVGSITDDEPTPQLSIADTVVGESGGSAIFTVTLSGLSSADVTANYATSNGTAAAGTDYTAATSVVTITAGLTQTTIAVPVLPDALDEDDESFTVTLAAPVNATLLDASATATIQDDDPTPTLSINDANLGEADGSVLFTVTLSAASGRALSVNYATADGSAISADYTPISGTLSFAAGETSKNIQVAVTDDSVVEGNEAFSVTLTSPVNATLADASGTASIADNDSAQLTIAVVGVDEGDVGAVDAVFTLTLSAPVDQPVTVNYATADGSTDADDYAATSGSVTFPALAVTRFITVSVNGDLTVEADETFTVTLDGLNAGGRNVSLTDAQAVGTIRNDDSAVVTLAQGPAQFEGDSGLSSRTVTATLDQPVQGGFTVDYATADGSAIAGDDYIAASGQLTFTGMQSETQIISLQIVGEDLAEGNEDFVIALGSFVGTALAANLSRAGSPQTIVIRNDDGAELSIADLTVDEDAGNAVLTITASAPSAVDVGVLLTTSPGSAAADLDYTSVSTQVTLTAGLTQTTVNVPILDDLLDETDESFTVTLSDAAFAIVADGDATVTIVDNDPPPSLAVADVVTDEGAGTATLTVTLNAASGLTVTVDYATADGDALNGADYTAVSGQLTIPAGETSGAISVPILDDRLDEIDESFSVALSNPGNASILDGDAVVTIADNDAPPLISIADVTVNEGAGTATLTVTLNAASGLTVTVDYATADGDALNGADYTAASGTLTVPAGETSGAISVPVLDDGLDEIDELFSVALSNPGNASILDGDAVVTIADNDAPPLLVLAEETVDEGAGTATITVGLLASSGLTVTVDYVTADGSALNGADYTAVSGTVTIPAGETDAEISVPILDDLLDESDESFTVLLSNPVNVTIFDSDAGVTIVDDDTSLFLPLLLRQERRSPDLIVQQINSAGQISVVIANQGDAAVNQSFWVDLYVDPVPVPQGPNEIWPNLSSYGATWGVTGAALPLGPGETLTLTFGDAYYVADLSRLPETLAAGSALYVQVDSANVATTYGGVFESHEISGDPYNNVFGPVVLGESIPPGAVDSVSTAAPSSLLPVR